MRLGVVSPFCDQTLSLLADLPSAEKPIFIGRSDELAEVPGVTLDGFARVAVLDEMSSRFSAAKRARLPDAIAHAVSSSCREHSPFSPERQRAMGVRA